MPNFDCNTNKIKDAHRKLGFCKLTYITLFIILMTASVSNAYFQRDDVLSETTVDPIKTKKLMEFLQISRQLTPAFQENQFKTEMRDHTNQPNHRSLSVASAVNSVVAGLGSSSMFTGDILSITVTAKDSSGNLLTTGGDIFTVKISNKCTKYNAYYCEPTGATSPLSANINDVMIDHNNGTYTYTYTLSSAGLISVQVYLLTPNQVYQERYGNSNTCNQTPLSTQTSSSLNISNGESVGGSSSPYYSSYIYIIGAIKAPKTGSENFYLNCDDGCLMSIEDNKSISNTCSQYCCNSTVICNLEENKYYTFFIKYSAIDDDYSFNIEWISKSNAQEVIPMSSVFLPNLVSNSPYTINVALTVCGDQLMTGTETCDDGNTISRDGCSSTCTVESGYACIGGSSTSKDTCTEICGDGIRFNSNLTYCDDGNTINRDGCSSTCIIESGYKCSGGNNTSKDICSLIFSVSSQEAAAAQSTQASVGAAVSVSAGASLLSMSSPIGVFCVMNQFQLLYILLASGVYVSDGVFNMITGLSIALFDFKFLNIEDINILGSFYSYLSIPQTNIDLNKIGLVSGSSFITLLKLMLVITILLIIHAIFMPVYYKCKKLDQRNICARLGNKLYHILTFSIYIRIFIQAYITILLSCFAEIYEFNVKSGIKKVLYSVNIIICALVFAFYGLCIWQIKKAHPKLNIKKQFYFVEFFSGLKNKTASRIYPAVFLGQRILSCLIVIVLGSLRITILMVILSVIQSLSLLYLLIVRPNEKIKDLVSECMSQGIMTFFCCMLIYFNTKDQWNSVINWVFIGTLMASTVVSTLIAFIDLFIIIVKKIRNCCCSGTRIENFRANRPTVVSNIGPDFANAISREYEAQMKTREENKMSQSASDLNISNLINHIPKTSVRF